MQDAHAAAFLHGGQVAKIVFVLHQLLTTAFDAIVKTLQVLLCIAEATFLSSQVLTSEPG